MSSAKQAVDSTIKRILIHMAEIIVSIVLLVIISIPLVFVIPMWFQQVALGASSSSLAVDPVAWFGVLGAVGVTTLLAIGSLVLGYIYVMGLSSRVVAREKKSRARREEKAEDSESESVETTAEDISSEVEGESEDAADAEVPDEDTTSE